MNKLQCYRYYVQVRLKPLYSKYLPTYLYIVKILSAVKNYLKRMPNVRHLCRSVFKPMFQEEYSSDYTSRPFLRFVSFNPT